MKPAIVASAFIMSSCVIMGDGILLIEAQMHKKSGGEFEICTLQVFFDDELYEKRIVPPTFLVDLTVAPGIHPARIDITCVGSDAVYSTITDGSEKINLGEIAL